MNFINDAYLFILVVKATICSLCDTELQLTGSHVPVSVKCGDIFGKSCIKQWLEGYGPVCPECDAFTTKSDIRPIYTRFIINSQGYDHYAVQAELDAKDDEIRQVELDIKQLQKGEHWPGFWYLAKAFVASSLVLNVCQLVQLLHRRF